jgi:hypothetical protein
MLKEEEEKERRRKWNKHKIIIREDRDAHKKLNVIFILFCILWLTNS